MEKPIGERFFEGGKLIEIMEGIDGCLGCCCPPGECYFWHKKLSECFMEQRSDGKHIIFHHVPKWWGERKNG